MKRALRNLLLLFAGILMLSVVTIAILFWPATIADDVLAEAKSGDLIFQSSTAHQATAIMLATGSRYSHVGILHRQPDGSLTVLDSAGKVGESPLATWIARGYGNRFTVMRDDRLSDTERAAMMADAKRYDGVGYDFIFWFDNDTLYCSELPYRLYQTLGKPLGRVQKIGDLNVDNPLVEELIAQRWQRHPRCQSATYEQCRQLLLDQELISPASLAEDPHLRVLYSNYSY